MYDDAAEAMGKTFVTTELGGGSITPEVIAIARKGLRNVLIHANILRGELSQGPTRHLSQTDDGCFHFAPGRGLVEYCVPLGELVEKGDLLARIWATEQTGQPPLDIIAKTDGLLTTRHAKGLIQPGDCLAVLAQEIL